MQIKLGMASARNSLTDAVAEARVEFLPCHIVLRVAQMKFLRIIPALAPRAKHLQTQTHRDLV